MKKISTEDLREFLTLLLPQQYEDHEGGWRDDWKIGPHLWAFLWPLTNSYHAQKGRKIPPPYYRIVIRSGVEVPSKAAFLWHLQQESKRLFLINTPILIQNNHFLCMTAREERYA